MSKLKFYVFAGQTRNLEEPLRVNICCHRYKKYPLSIQVASITLVQLDLGIAEKLTEFVG